MRNHSRDDQCEDDDDHEGEEGDCRVEQEKTVYERTQEPIGRQSDLE